MGVGTSGKIVAVAPMVAAVAEATTLAMAVAMLTVAVAMVVATASQPMEQATATAMAAPVLGTDLIRAFHGRGSRVTTLFYP